MNIIFWQDMFSMHQADFLRELSLRSNAHILWIVERALTQERKSQGWEQPPTGDISIITGPSIATIERTLIDHSDKNSIHVFSGYSHHFVNRVLRSAVKLPNIRLALMSESGHARGVTGVLNYFRSQYLLREIRHKVRAVFAIGSLGMRWYRKIGFNEETLFPFGYFVASSELTTNSTSRTTTQPAGPMSFVFVGQHIDRKAGDLLLNAFSQIHTTKNWSLNFIGDGPRRWEWEELTKRLGLEERVRFHGVIANSSLADQLVKHDCLVLPSHWDGWGVVTNEALAAGTKVLCSDFCGSSTLIGEPSQGKIFRAGSLQSLTQVLKEQIHQGPATLAQRQSLRDWASAISPSAAAEYFLEALKFAYDWPGAPPARPVPPWY